MKNKYLIKKYNYKTIIFSLLCIILIGIVNLIFYSKINIYQTVYAYDTSISHKASILIDRNTKNILQENNSHQKLPIASITKLMTILLTLEKLENNEISLESDVEISTKAGGMGGSQIFLDSGEKYKLSELLKSVIIASANDSSIALAEFIAGSENNFVQMMNEKASILNMSDTHYSNCTGLPSAEGYSSAYDQAILLNHVLDFDIYREYSKIWMQDFTHPSGRVTQMANTNKLSRFYEGCIGGKTGSTNEAKYCLAIGAERNNMQLISVVLGANNSQDRFQLASQLLNYGFDNFICKTIFSEQELKNINLKIKGTNKSIEIKPAKNYNIIVEKNKKINFSFNYNLPSMLKEVEKGQIIGNVEILIDGVVVEQIDILSNETVFPPSIWDYFSDIIKN